MSSPGTEPDSVFTSTFRILVVGAGPVGLALAALLQRKGFKITVLEQDEVMKEVGFLQQVD